jgi:drug/metabolite transporter (DMT)-like permease
MTALPARDSALPERPILIAFLLFVVTLGGASVAIRISYGEMAPFMVATSRFTLGALVFWGLVFYRKIPIPKGRALAGAVIFGILTVGLAFMLIAWGLVETPASLYQILMALVPLLTLFLSSMQGVEVISRRGVLGALLAVVGIAVTVGGTSASDVSWPHIAAILVAALFFAEGAVLTKRFPPNPPIMTNAISLTVGAIILGFGSLVSGEEWIIPSQTSTWIAFIYLVIFVTIISFLLYMFVLSKWTASGTSYGFVIAPLITIVIASTLAEEAVKPSFLLGAGLVLAGVFFGALLPSKAEPAALKECRDGSGQILPRCV